MRKVVLKYCYLVIATIIIFGISIFSISYYVLSKLTFARDSVFYGKSQSELAREIRDELLKRSDIAEVSFYSKDNIKLAGYFLGRENAQANLLLCHGYRGGKEFMYGYLDMFPKFNILMFDFRAHGQSEGKITSIGCHEYKDVIAAAHFLKDKTTSAGKKPLPLIIIGISMGGAASIKAAETDAGLCDALIIDSTYSDLKRTIIKTFSAKSGLPHYPFYPIVKTMLEYFGGCSLDIMNTSKAVRKIYKPILFIHSCNDNFTSPKNSLMLYENASSKYAKLWIGPKCRHGWLHSYYSELYKKKVTKFLAHALPMLSAP